MGMLSKLLGRTPLYEPEYLFNPVRIPLPGQAYHAPLIQFQDYPQTMVQGPGVFAQAMFRPFAPQFDTTMLNPVQGATIGTITGQLWRQPLVDSSIGNVG